MTNEELVQAYYQGSSHALEQLCRNNRDFIRSVAVRAADTFNYSDIEELCSVGMVAFLELLNSRSYDPEKSRLSTYFYPHLQGAMCRYLEKNTGSIPLSKHQMELVRKAQRLYNEANLAVDAVAKELGITPARAALLINHNTHTISFDALNEEDQSSLVTESVEYTVLKGIQIALLGEQFRKLPARDQYILGSCYGVFGFEQKSVDDLSFEEILTPDGVYKAKEAALERLRKLCRDSAIPLWRQAYILTRRAAQGNGDITLPLKTTNLAASLQGM